MNFQKLNLFFVVLLYFRMAPEVIACDEQPDATYDNRVCLSPTSSVHCSFVKWKRVAVLSSFFC